MSDHTTSSPIDPATVICELGIRNQLLIHKSLELGLYQEAKELRQLDRQLVCLRKEAGFDFVKEVARGRTLLVGEGNLSFASSLSKMQGIVPGNLIATTFEKKSDLSEATLANVNALRKRGVTVLHGIDATKLASIFGSWRFSTIMFQFPHAGSRTPVEGRNPNFILVRDFLKNARPLLHLGGSVLISAVDTPHYQGAFQFEEVAEIAKFKQPEVYAFDPDAFPEYEHTMTHQSGNALDNHDTFSTWVFRT